MSNSTTLQTCLPSQISCNDTSISPHRSICLEAKDFSCDWYSKCDRCPPLIADPEIAGIGFIIAFIASAGLTLILSLVYLLFRPPSDFKIHNPINRFLRRFLAARFQKLVGDKTAAMWEGCLFKVVMMLSDQQLITGTAMISTAIYLRYEGEGGISTYHFAIATDLAWFSANVHLTSLIVLRSFLSEERKKRTHAVDDGERKTHQGVLSAFPALWRLAFMLALAALLVYGTSISGVNQKNFSCPISCLVDQEPDGFSIASPILISVGYGLEVAHFLAVLRDSWFGIRKGIKHIDQEVPSLLGKYPRLCQAYSILRVFVLGIWWISLSEVFSVVFSIAFFFWGIYVIIWDRKAAHDIMDHEEVQAEDVWGFGQLLALLLLILPFMTFWEELYSSWSNLHKQDSGLKRAALISDTLTQKVQRS